MFALLACRAVNGCGDLRLSSVYQVHAYLRSSEPDVLACLLEAQWPIWLTAAPDTPLPLIVDECPCLAPLLYCSNDRVFAAVNRHFVTSSLSPQASAAVSGLPSRQQHALARLAQAVDLFRLPIGLNDGDIVFVNTATAFHHADPYTPNGLYSSQAVRHWLESISTL